MRRGRFSAHLLFVTWQPLRGNAQLGGRIKSDLRFNKLLTWNTFPLPATDIDARRRIIAAAQEVPAARQLQPDLSLADLYAPTTMSNELQHAHHALDGEVDQLFGLASQHPTEPERQDVLFTRYQAMTAMSRPPFATSEHVADLGEQCDASGWGPLSRSAVAVAFGPHLRVVQPTG